MTPSEERQSAVAETVARIHDIAARQGITREGVDGIKQVLIGLAEQRSLFTFEDFPLPSPDGDDNCNLYLLAEDENRQFALYLQACLPGLDVPPHNHATWAVIAGMQGTEQNRFYQRKDDGAEETGRFDVEGGTGVAMLPEDLHSIHIHGDQSVLNFHMYGRALDTIDDREYWSAKNGDWRLFPPQEGIIDRRAG